VPAPAAIIHVDMDAFYASVEQRDHPDLRGRPVIVGGHPTRGVVLAASYEVRPFGVRSAMPMAQALRLAPKDAVVVPPHFEAYATASEQVFAIFEAFTPLVEPLSLDEAFLDVTASRRLFGTPAEIAARIRKRIATELSLPASAGIASVKFVAKMASDLAKPNGQKEIGADETLAFLGPLPVARLWGVGKKTEATMSALGLRTIGDLRLRDPEWLERRVPGGRDLWRLAHGIDPRPIVPDRAAKSIGAEDTFGEDLPADATLHPHIHAQALRVGRRLRQAGTKTRVVQLKLKFADFSLITRRQTLEEPTDDGQALYRVAVELLARVAGHKEVRLTGVSAQDLGPPQGEIPQLSMFAAPATRQDRLNRALDRIVDKFGAGSIATADLASAGEDGTDDS
jgi:DNA polymerase-4